MGKQRRSVAKTGTIPQAGEIWVPVCPRGHFMGIHLVDIAVARDLMPEGLAPIAVLPGKTLGGVLLGYYGPGSTLEYHELAVMTGLARRGRKWGLWVSDLYVDSEASVIGGSRLGLDKQLAAFDWPGGMPPFHATVIRDAPILTVDTGPGIPLLPFSLGGGSFSKLDNHPLWFFSRFYARWRLCRARYTVPTGSPLAPLGLKRSLIAVAAREAKGFMVEKITRF